MGIVWLLHKGKYRCFNKVMKGYNLLAQTISNTIPGRDKCWKGKKEKNRMKILQFQRVMRKIV